MGTFSIANLTLSASHLGEEKPMWSRIKCVFFNMLKVTEEVRKNIEVRLKESAEFQTQLEKKLMEVEKEKQELQDDKRRAIESMEQQVSRLPAVVAASVVRRCEFFP